MHQDYHVKVGVPPKRWKDARYAGIREALEFLGAPTNVKIHIRRTSATRLIGGCDRLKDGTYRILISARLTLEKANETLLHELVHVWQHETVPNFGTAYSNELLRKGYRTNRFEVEARELADLMKSDIIVVK